MNLQNDLRKILSAAGARQDEGIRKIKKGPHVVVLALGRGAQKKSNGYFLKAFDWVDVATNKVDERATAPAVRELCIYKHQKLTMPFSKKASASQTARCQKGIKALDRAQGVHTLSEP